MFGKYRPVRRSLAYICKGRISATPKIVKELHGSDCNCELISILIGDAYGWMDVPAKFCKHLAGPQEIGDSTGAIQNVARDSNANVLYSLWKPFLWK